MPRIAIPLIVAALVGGAAASDALAHHASADVGPLSSCGDACDTKASACLDTCEAKHENDAKARTECKLRCATEREKCDKSCK